nr:hypothetical protein [Paraglaciecola sp. T6c]
MQDIDFDYKCLRAYNGKGKKHRVVTLATELIPLLRNQIVQVDEHLRLDIQNEQYAGVWMPHALAKRPLQRISRSRGRSCFPLINLAQIQKQVR